MWACPFCSASSNRSCNFMVNNDGSGVDRVLVLVTAVADAAAAWARIKLMGIFVVRVAATTLVVFFLATAACARIRLIGIFGTPDFLAAALGLLLLRCFGLLEATTVLLLLLLHILPPPAAFAAARILRRRLALLFVVVVAAKICCCFWVVIFPPPPRCFGMFVVTGVGINMFVSTVLPVVVVGGCGGAGGCGSPRACNVRFDHHADLGVGIRKPFRCSARTRGCSTIKAHKLCPRRNTIFCAQRNPKARVVRSVCKAASRCGTGVRLLCGAPASRARMSSSMRSWTRSWIARSIARFMGVFVETRVHFGGDGGCFSIAIVVSGSTVATSFCCCCGCKDNGSIMCTFVAWNMSFVSALFVGVGSAAAIIYSVNAAVAAAAVAAAPAAVAVAAPAPAAPAAVPSSVRPGTTAGVTPTVSSAWALTAWMAAADAAAARRHRFFSGNDETAIVVVVLLVLLLLLLLFDGGGTGNCRFLLDVSTTPPVIIVVIESFVRFLSLSLSLSPFTPSK